MVETERALHTVMHSEKHLENVFGRKFVSELVYATVTGEAVMDLWAGLRGGLRSDRSGRVCLDLKEFDRCVRSAGMLRRLSDACRDRDEL